MVDADELRRAFEYVPPLTNDRMFKAIFAKPGHEVALVGLLNGLLGYEGDERVVDIEHLSPHLGGDSHESKLMLLDLLVRDGAGRTFNIEVQRGRDAGLVPRFMCYASRVLSEQRVVGDEWVELRPSIVVVIADVTLFTEHRNVYTKMIHFDVINDGAVRTDLVQVHYFELPKLARGTTRGCTPVALDWLHVLQSGHDYGEGRKPLPDHIARQEGLRMTMTYYDEASTDPNVRLAAYKLRLREEERKAQLRESKAMGRAEGRAEGRVEGRVEGRAEGRAEGKTEERLATARKMRARGYSAEVIADLTGLSLADLERPDTAGEA